VSTWSVNSHIAKSNNPNAAETTCTVLTVILVTRLLVLRMNFRKNNVIDMGIHLSDDHELREAHEADKNKALKNSLKYASKYRKKDKELEHYSEFTDFFDDLWAQTKNAAETEMDNEKYTKAKSYYKYLCTIDPEDPGATLMLAAVYQQLKSRKEAELTYEKASNLLIEFGGKGLREVQTELLHSAIIYNVELLANINRSAALEWLALGQDLFRGEPEFEAVRRSIGG